MYLLNVCTMIKNDIKRQNPLTAAEQKNTFAFVMLQYVEILEQQKSFYRVGSTALLS